MSQLSSPSPLDRILELKDEAEKQKVELTPEVRAYIQSHLDIVQGKLSKGEAVTEDDMKFIEEVRMWVGLPEEWKGKYPTIHGMNEDRELMQNYREAKKRNISLQQWLDLLHVAEAVGKHREWIDHQFHFLGGGKMKVSGELFLAENTVLTHLPQGLEVTEGLLLYGCTSLTSVPEDLKVGGMLFLNDCMLLNNLPKNLKVKGLEIKQCLSLSNLPEDLEIDGNLYLSDNLQTKVKEAAKRLKKEGKIKGKIKYIDEF